MDNIDFTADANEVAVYGERASMRAYDLESELKRIKSIATMARGLSKLMELDYSLTLKTTIGEIISRSQF